MAEVSSVRTDAPARATALVTGGIVYLLFFAVLLYFIGFLADRLVPRSVDAGGPESTTTWAVIVDALLVLLFAVSHSAMARPAVKARMRRVVPLHLERSAYVLTATAALALLFWQWRPLPDVVWDLDGAAAAVLWSTYALGWFIVVLSTFLISHFDLFGLRQVYAYSRGRELLEIGFRTPMLYRFVRHPMMVGFFLVFWSAPTLTAGHLLLAGLLTGYVLVGVQLEERDLRATLPDYAAYASRVPQFVPGVRRNIG